MRLPPRTTRSSNPVTGPSGVSWRRVTFDDVDAIVELYAAIAQADHPEWTETREEIEDELHHSWIDLAADSVIVEADGQVVATGLQIAPPDPETIVRSIAFGGVRPSHRGRGIGRALTEWRRVRGRQHVAASDLDLPGWIMFYVEERNTSQLRLAEHLDLPFVRYFTKMKRDLVVDISDLALPDGLELAIPTAADSARILEAKSRSSGHSSLAQEGRRTRTARRSLPPVPRGGSREGGPGCRQREPVGSAEPLHRNGLRTVTRSVAFVEAF